MTACFTHFHLLINQSDCLKPFSASFLKLNGKQFSHANAFGYGSTLAMENLSCIEKQELNLCMLGNFLCFSCRLLTFLKFNFRKSFRNIIRVSNSFDPDKDRCSVLIWVQTVCKGYRQTPKKLLLSMCFKIID